MNKKLQKEFDALEKSRIDLFNKLDKLNASKMNKQPDANSWSVVQVMDHLIQAETNSVVYINKKLSFNPQLKKANFNTVFRMFLLKAALTLPMKWKAPKSMAVANNDRTDAEAKAAWAAVRKNLSDLLEKFPEGHLDAELFKHPVAGKFTIVQAVSFMHTHLGHHLSQIDRINRAVQ